MSTDNLIIWLITCLISIIKLKIKNSPNIIFNNNPIVSPKKIKDKLNNAVTTISSKNNKISNKNFFWIPFTLSKSNLFERKNQDRAEIDIACRGESGDGIRTHDHGQDHG